MTPTSSLAYKDLRGYLEAVDGLGELRLVHGADWDLEIGAITEVSARAASPKTVLFDEIKGFPKGFRVVTNAVCSAATTALAFGPKDVIPPAFRRKGVKYIYAGRLEWLDMGPVTKVIKQAQQSSKENK